MSPHVCARQRGSASVEAALSMILIVPAFLYALFLDDLLRYAGDLQEAVVSTPWDFTYQDYTRPDELGLARYSPVNPPGGRQLVQSHARLMFCDHESSGDSYNQGKDCNGEDHHKGKALSGHVCWLNTGAQQVTCEVARADIGELGRSHRGMIDPAFSGYKSAFGNNGGLFECHAQSVVENYLLPKRFLPEFSKKDLVKKNWNTSPNGIHKNARDGTEDTAYYLAKQHFAVVTDPWALNERKNQGLEVAPGNKKGPLYDRVAKIYQSTPLYAPLLASYPSFLAQANAQRLLLPASPTYDNLLLPNVSLQPRNLSQPIQMIPQDTGTQGYFATPWRDGAGNAYERTAGARGAYYMGCQTQEGC